MGEEARFSEKWDFRRKENNFDDSSGDDPDQDPNIVLDSNQLDNGTETVTREEPVKTRKRRNKKDESKPEKAKQVRKRKPKTAPVEEKEKKKKEETVMDGVETFMETLLDDLKASREGLMDWMKTELCGSDQNAASPPPIKKRAVVAAQRSVKRKPRAKKKVSEEGEEEKKENETQSKPDENVPEMMNKAKEKSAEIAQNVQELDCNAGPLDRFLKSGQGGLGRNYFQQQQQQQVLVERTEIENSKNEETVKNKKTIVLAIEAQNWNQRQKKTSEANTIKRSRTGSESQKDHNFMTPFAPALSSPVASSLNSFFPSSSQGAASLASNNNFQVIPPPLVSQIPDHSEFQTEFTGGLGFGNSLFPNNGYFSGFPAAFQPSQFAGGFNFPAQLNPVTSSQLGDDNNMFGGLRMGGGAIRLSGSRFSQTEASNGNYGPSDYRTGSGR